MRMKHLLASSLLLFFLGKTVCQNAFYDTKYIIGKTDKIREYEKKLKILNPLPAELDSMGKFRIDGFNQIVKFVNNPFDTTVQLEATQIRQVMDDVPKIVAKVTLSRDTVFKNRTSPIAYETSSTAPQSGMSGARLSAIPSTSFLSATSIIDGTALFIKRRVKEELSVAFLDRFRKRLNENEFLGRLLPSTHRLLQSVVDMDNSLPSLNNIAINAFQSDLETLPENIENTLLYDTSFAEIRKDRAFKYFALPFNTIKHIKLGSHPAWVLQDLGEKYFTDTTELDRIVQMMVALNDNLRDTTISGYDPDENLWITGKQWDELKPQKGNELFMGLLFQKNKDGIFSTLKNRPPTDIRKSMLLLSENVDEYLVQLKGFEKMYHNIQVSPNRAATDSMALELGWSILQLVDKSHWLYFTLLEQNQQFKLKKLYWDTLKPIAEATLKAVSSVQRKNYGGLILNSYQILRGLSQIKNWEGGKVFGDKYIQSFFYYGNFMTDVLMANNGEEVANILDRYAAPVGSYSIKRRAKFSLSLNAFPGLFMGWEKPRQPDLLRGVSQTSFVTGVTAPIGLAFNFGGFTSKNDALKKKGDRNYQSLSAFISVIDIGAVLSYRWANDQAQGLPQSVEWAQVLAPGLHLVYGLPNLPLAINAGFQVAPKLRKVTLDTGNEVKNTDFWRFNIGLTTDITIFNFYSSGRVRERK
jgi:hypothetical protein